MWKTIATTNRMNVTSWVKIASSRRIAGNVSGNHKTTPESSSPSAPSPAAKKNSFWPPLYLPTSWSSPWYLMYWAIFRGRSHSRSLRSRRMSPSQWTNITSAAAKKSRPDHGWSQRHTLSPPNRCAIQPKIGVQIGSPERRATKKKRATVQWMTRVERRCRTISSPTRTSSVWRARRIAGSADGDHVALGPELQAAGRTRPDAGRLQPRLAAVHAQRALRHLPGLGVELRHVEGTPGRAEAAADAGLGVHVHDAVLVLDDGARRRAGREAARVLAVHALVLAHQPDDAAVEFLLVEADQVPELRVQLGHGLVGAGLPRGHRPEVVPLLAGHFAGLAADAGGGVDELRHDGQVPHPCLLSPEGGRGAAYLEVLR